MSPFDEPADGDGPKNAAGDSAETHCDEQKPQYSEDDVARSKV